MVQKRIHGAIYNFIKKPAGHYDQVGLGRKERTDVFAFPEGMFHIRKK